MRAPSARREFEPAFEYGGANYLLFFREQWIKTIDHADGNARGCSEPGSQCGGNVVGGRDDLSIRA
jgi:hypothetical protein